MISGVNDGSFDKKRPEQVFDDLLKFFPDFFKQKSKLDEELVRAGAFDMLTKVETLNIPSLQSLDKLDGQLCEQLRYKIVFLHIAEFVLSFYFYNFKDVELFAKLERDRETELETLISKILEEYGGLVHKQASKAEYSKATKQRIKSLCELVEMPNNNYVVFQTNSQTFTPEPLGERKYGTVYFSNERYDRVPMYLFDEKEGEIRLDKWSIEPQADLNLENLDGLLVEYRVRRIQARNAPNGDGWLVEYCKEIAKKLSSSEVKKLKRQLKEHYALLAKANGRKTYEGVESYQAFL